jgi:hypothetical protein
MRKKIKKNEWQAFYFYFFKINKLLQLVEKFGQTYWLFYFILFQNDFLLRFLIIKKNVLIQVNPVNLPNPWHALNQPRVSLKTMTKTIYIFIVH